ncbi:rhodanese-like domain-containing protein [Nocardioides ochotonae]|uniref:rhodanese-like domain-containing protein n=1 Tax=Nocardioides ochotonae TaxID=2685869 RepID=UPI00140E602D|nr:rhodanese-like domain-containing protein [Nocardioides ochotonae]
MTSPAAPGSPLVSAGWLLEHIGEAGLVVLDASITRGEDEDGRTVFSDGEATYLAGHVTGAVFADLFSVWSDPDGEYGFTRPTPVQVEAAARAAGIGPDSTVVVYDQLSGAYAARVWLVLRSYGFADVRLLDGGYAAWRAAGGAVETGPGPRVVPGAGFTAVDAGVFADLDEVREVALGPGSGVRLVCALRRPEFLGDEARERSGHIPGSVNLPYPDVLDEDGTVSPDRTRALATGLGIDAGTPVVAYCGGGVNAAGLALAFVEAGLPLPRVYDASLNEWRARTELPMEVGEGSGTSRETLVVFDIDGTLLHSDGQHNAIITAVLAGHGLDATIKAFGTYTHYTDSCVINEVHEATFGATASAELLAQLDREYREALEAHVAEHPIVEVPGARRVVEELAALPGVHTAFATGSLRGMAELKLGLVGVDAAEVVLSTAGEHYSREEIVRAAIAGVVERVGHDRLDLVILGDGAWDERTAAQLGIPFVGLATGSHTFGAQAVRVLDDYTGLTGTDLVALARPWPSDL